MVNLHQIRSYFHFYPFNIFFNNTFINLLIKYRASKMKHRSFIFPLKIII